MDKSQLQTTPYVPICTMSSYMIGNVKQLRLAKKTASAVESLPNFVYNFPEEWSLLYLSDIKWKLLSLKENLVFQSLLTVLSEENQQLCNQLNLESSLTITVCSEGIRLEQCHSFNSASKWTQLVLLNNISSWTLSNLLQLWKLRFAHINRFFGFLTKFVSGHNLTLSILPPSEGLDVTLKIENWELQFYLMEEQKFERLQLCAKMVAPQSLDKVIFINFSNFINFKNSIVHFFQFLKIQLLERRIDIAPQNRGMNIKQKIEQRLKKILFETHQHDPFMIIRGTVGHQWIIMLKQPYQLFAKVALNMHVKHDEIFCLQPLESILTFTLLKLLDKSQCMLNETHKITSPRAEKCQWMTEGTAERLLARTSEILKSWLSQFRLVESFFSQLADFLSANGISISIKKPDTPGEMYELQFISFAIGKVHTINCLLIPSSDRPFIRVEINSGKAFRAKTVCCFKPIFDYITVLLSKEVSAKKRKGEVLEAKPKRICTKVEECNNSPQSVWQPSFLSLLMLEMKALLMQHPLECPGDINADRSALLDKLKIWRQSGYDVSLEPGINWESIQAVHGHIELKLEFKDIMGGPVDWKLKLDSNACMGAGLGAEGSSTVFYRQVMSCLQRFLDQKQEESIKVEVEVDVEVPQSGRTDTKLVLDDLLVRK